MEFFNNAKAVRLKSHLGKYLAADDDRESVRQTQDGASRKARWRVELVDGNPHVIRLRSCHGRYLTVSDEPYLLGMTGKKVLQASATPRRDAAMEWEPIKEGYSVKLRSKGGRFLRANGATPPWRNSVTYDLPYRTATQDWVMWGVDEVDVSELDDDDQYLPRLSNASSFSDSSSPNSPTVRSGRSPATTDGLRKSIFAAERWRPSLDRSANHSSGRQEGGMEFFDKAKAVRLQSHLGKYLVADDDETTVRQSRNGAWRNARWAVEFVEGKRDSIRLKSCHGSYLTAAEEPFLLGMTGKKVLLTPPEGQTDAALIEWLPVKEGASVKLMTGCGKFLRANGGSPPWRNSVTHDVPHRTATQSWVLWGVEVVDIAQSDPRSDLGSGWLSPMSSFSSIADDYSGSPVSSGSPVFRKEVSGIDLFKRAKSVRLKSHHNKYLTADSDEEHVIQDRSGSRKSVKWTVEFVEGSDDVIRLKSCYGRYLKAEDEEFLLGVTGRKVVQSLPPKLDSSVEWEPLKENDRQVRLKTRYGNYLRANGGLPPWRNSITHDIPHRHHGWILWEVDVVEIRPESPPRVVERSRSRSRSVDLDADVDLSSTSFHLTSSAHVSNMYGEETARKSEGRMIHYYVVDDDGNESEEESFQFRGQGLEELTEKLEDLTGLEDIIVCSRNILNGKLYPLKLALPPNNATMHVAVVPPTSTVANDFLPPS